MKALSIKDPWAWLVLNAGKDIENRTWAMSRHMIGQRIYVHVGKKLDYGAFEGDPTYRRLDSWIRERISVEASMDWDNGFSATRLGAIVGEVTVVDCVTESSSPWFEGLYGYVLANPVAYETPVPYRGQLGFFEVEL